MPEGSSEGNREEGSDSGYILEGETIGCANWLPLEVTEKKSGVLHQIHSLRNQLDGATKTTMGN